MELNSNELAKTLIVGSFIHSGQDLDDLERALDAVLDEFRRCSRKEAQFRLTTTGPVGILLGLYLSPAFRYTLATLLGLGLAAPVLRWLARGGTVAFGRTVTEGLPKYVSVDDELAKLALIREYDRRLQALKEESEEGEPEGLIL